MSICMKCKKEFDPSEDFVEDNDTCERLIAYAEDLNLCSDCWNDLDQSLFQAVDIFMNK